MKKIFKRIILMAVLVFVFGLFGCGSTLTTELEISDNFAGTRTMDVSISKTDFDEYVTNGNFQVIAEDTKTNTPECMQFSYEETEDGNYIFHFVMPFTSKEDYETKVASVLGTGYTVDFSVSKSPFAQGVTLTEDFSSSDLLKWFKEYLIANGYVEEADAAYIFEYTDNIVTINGKEFDSYSDKLQVSEKTYVDISDLNIFTDIDAANGTISRKIEILFDSSVLTNNRPAVETYLTKVTPEGCEGEWSVTEDGYEKFTLVTTSCTPAEMTQIMKTFCGSEECSVELAAAGENEEESEGEISISFSDVWDQEVLGADSTEEQVDSEIFVQPFGYESVLEENLDLSNFICDSWGEIDSNYYISQKNGKPDSIVITPEGEEIYGWDYVDSTYTDYYYIESQWRPVYQVVSTLHKYYVPVSTEVNTIVKSEDKITREFVFKFAEPFDEAVVEKIESKMDSLFDRYEDILSVEIKNNKKDTRIIWEFKGTVAEVDAVCDEIFGMGYSHINYYGQDRFSLKQQFNYTESIDLGAIFAWEYNGNIDYSLEAPGKINKEYSSITGGISSGAEFKGKKATYLASESGYMYANIDGAKTNILMIGIIVGLIVFMLAVAGGIVFVVLKLANQKPQNAGAQGNMVNNVQPTMPNNVQPTMPNNVQPTMPNNPQESMPNNVQE